MLVHCAVDEADDPCVVDVSSTEQALRFEFKLRVHDMLNQHTHVLTQVVTQLSFWGVNLT